MARPGLTTHRKFRRLARAVGSAIVARGALELLWEAAYEAGEDYVGTSDDIETLVGWSGEHGMLTRALVDAGAPEGHGFLEPVDSSTDGATGSSRVSTRYRIHDLWHHAPDYVMKRRQRELQRQGKEDPILSHRRTAPNGGHRTQSPDCQIEVGRTPAPAPTRAPAPKEEPSRTLSAENVVAIWNELTTRPIPEVKKLTNDRRAKIQSRIKTFPDEADWRAVIAWVNGQSWCRAPGTGEHPQWTASLDWLCKSDGNVQRYLEKAQSQRPSKSAVTVWECPHVDHCSSRSHCENNLRIGKKPIKAAAS